MAAKKRNDPAHRPVTDILRRGQPKNLRPDRHYVKVYKAAGFQGIDYYEDIGYEVEHHRADGPKLPGKREYVNGTPIEHMDHVLMSCPMERKREIDQFGPDGDGGQQIADLLEEKLIDKRSGIEDPMRGMHGIRRYLGFENKTSQAEAED